MSFVATQQVKLPVDGHRAPRGAVAGYNQPKNRVFNNVRSQLHVSDNVVTQQLIVDSLDTRDLLNTVNQGVRIIDQRLGNARYAVSERQVQVTGFGNQVVGPGLPLTQALTFSAVLVPGLQVSGLPSASITLPDTGIYAFAANVSIPAYPSGPTVTYTLQLVRVSPAFLASSDDVVAQMTVTNTAGDLQVTRSMEGTELMTAPGQDRFALQVVRRNAADVVTVSDFDVRAFVLATA